MTMRDELKALVKRYRGVSNNPPEFKDWDVQTGYEQGCEWAADDIEEILTKYPEMVDEPHREEE